ncbi:DUF2894 domain-containing protein [Aquabacterium sp.]|uniref:DUF2894 domain-containing protein n=1 Tax=Aquabacterium sp. TaxID=1872578 RepID=UPI0025C221C8|nr:DUF2894 domain-containing protein [Aquabacterium sp.]
MPAMHTAVSAELDAARQTLAGWREQGHALLDPMGWAHIEALLKRLPSQPPAVQAVLRPRLALAMQRHAARVAQAREAGASRVQAALQQQPELAREARRLQAAADHTGLHRLALRAELMPRPCLPLQALNQHIQQALRQASEGGLPMAAPAAGERAEMKSLQRFRDTWVRISAEDEIDKAIGRAPDNAGPLNSHMLVLRSLELMRGLSPAYLQRFMSQLDALLWLDQVNQKPTAPSAKAGRGGKAKG